MQQASVLERTLSTSLVFFFPKLRNRVFLLLEKHLHLEGALCFSLHSTWLNLRADVAPEQGQTVLEI